MMEREGGDSRMGIAMEEAEYNLRVMSSGDLVDYGARVREGSMEWTDLDMEGLELSNESSPFNPELETRIKIKNDKNPAWTELFTEYRDGHDKYCDVQLIADDGQLMIHWPFLEYLSPILQKQMRGTHTCESCKKEAQAITLSGFQLKDVRPFVRMIYGGEPLVTLDQEQRIQEILELLQITGLNFVMEPVTLGGRPSSPSPSGALEHPQRDLCDSDVPQELEKIPPYQRLRIKKRIQRAAADSRRRKYEEIKTPMRSAPGEVVKLAPGTQIRMGRQPKILRPLEVVGKTGLKLPPSSDESTSDEEEETNDGPGRGRRVVVEEDDDDYLPPQGNDDRGGDEETDASDVEVILDWRSSHEEDSSTPGRYPKRPRRRWWDKKRGDDFMCGICKESFPDLEGLKSHLDNFCGKDLKEEYILEEKYCCGCQSYWTGKEYPYSWLLEHVSICRKGRKKKLRNKGTKASGADADATSNSNAADGERDTATFSEATTGAPQSTIQGVEETVSVTIERTGVEGATAQNEMDTVPSQTATTSASSSMPPGSSASQESEAATPSRSRKLTELLRKDKRDWLKRRCRVQKRKGIPTKLTALKKLGQGQQRRTQRLGAGAKKGRGLLQDSTPSQSAKLPPTATATVEVVPRTAASKEASLLDSSRAVGAGAPDITRNPEATAGPSTSTPTIPAQNGTESNELDGGDTAERLRVTLRKKLGPPLAKIRSRLAAAGASCNNSTPAAESSSTDLNPAFGAEENDSGNACGIPSNVLPAENEETESANGTIVIVTNPSESSADQSATYEIVNNVIGLEPTNEDEMIDVEETDAGGVSILGNERTTNTPQPHNSGTTLMEGDDDIASSSTSRAQGTAQRTTSTSTSTSSCPAPDTQPIVTIPSTHSSSSSQWSPPASPGNGQSSSISTNYVPCGPTNARSDFQRPGLTPRAYQIPSPISSAQALVRSCWPNNVPVPVAGRTPLHIPHQPPSYLASLLASNLQRWQRTYRTRTAQVAAAFAVPSSSSTRAQPQQASATTSAASPPTTFGIPPRATSPHRGATPPTQCNRLPTCSPPPAAVPHQSAGLPVTQDLPPPRNQGSDPSASARVWRSPNPVPSGRGQEGSVGQPSTSTQTPNQNVPRASRNTLDGKPLPQPRSSEVSVNDDDLDAVNIIDEGESLEIVFIGPAGIPPQYHDHDCPICLRPFRSERGRDEHMALGRCDFGL